MDNWLLCSFKHSPWGNSAVWWKPNSRGYTSRLEEAGRYSEEEAKDIERSSHRSAVAVPEADALAVAHTAVDFHVAANNWRGDDDG